MNGERTAVSYKTYKRRLLSFMMALLMLLPILVSLRTEVHAVTYSIRGSLIDKNIPGDKTSSDLGGKWPTANKTLTYQSSGTYSGKYTNTSMWTNEPTCSGYTFKGWAVNKNESDSSRIFNKTNNTTFVLTQSDINTYADPSTGYIVVYAIWERNASYTMSFNAGSNGTISSFDEHTPAVLSSNGRTVSYKINYGEAYSNVISSVPVATSSVNLVFRAWDYSGYTLSNSNLSDVYGLNSSGSFTALWSYHLYFNLNPPAGHTTSDITNPPTSMNKKIYAGGSASLWTNVPALTGYTFRGWALNRNETNSSNIYAAGSTFTATSSDISTYGGAVDQGVVYLYAIWEKSGYNLTFNANSGSLSSYDTSITTPTVSGQNVIYKIANGEAYNKVFASVPVVTRTGYTFGGWRHLDSGFVLSNNNLGETYSLTSAATLTAQWTANTYTVTLNKQSGSGGTSSVTATYGSAMPAITVPTRSGYTFGGYYTGTGGSGTQYYTASGASARTWNIDGARTLYAKWTEITRYNLTFNANGGTLSSYDTSLSTPTVSGNNVTYTIANGEAYSSRFASVPVVAKSGYTFGGWLHTATGYVLSNANLSDTYSLTAAATLTAQWSANTYTVTLNKQSGSGGTSSVTATYGSAMPSITVPTRSGYTFGGYYTGTNGTGTQYYTASGASANAWGVAANTTLYAKWTSNAYTMTFNANGGTLVSYDSSTSTATVSGNNVSYGIDYGQSYYSVLHTVPVVTKTGYTFGTWRYTSGDIVFDMDNSVLQNTGNTYGLTSNGTFYATWTAKSCTVVFNKQSGSGGTDSVTATYGSAMPSITPPSRAGYTFAGYYSGTGGSGTKYYNADGSSARTWNVDTTSNTTLYAKWTANSYTITFNSNGGTLTGYDTGVSTPSVTGQNVTYTISYGSAYNTVMSYVPTATRTGYDFAGWYYNDYRLSNDNLTDLYSLVGNGTLTARWESAASYTVRLYYNDGTQNIFYENTYASGDTFRFSSLSGIPSYTLSSGIPATFKGWARTSTASSAVYPYTNGAYTTTSFTVTSTVNLYAVWCTHSTWSAAYNSSPYGVSWQQNSGGWLSSYCGDCGAEVKRAYSLSFYSRHNTILFYSDFAFFNVTATSTTINVSKYKVPCETGSKSASRVAGWHYGTVGGTIYSGTVTITANTIFYAAYNLTPGGAYYYEMILDAGSGGKATHNIDTTASSTAFVNPTSSLNVQPKRYEVVVIAHGENYYIDGSSAGAVTSSFPRAFADSNGNGVYDSGLEWIYPGWYLPYIVSGSSQVFYLNYRSASNTYNAYATSANIDSGDSIWPAISTSGSYQIRYHASNRDMAGNYNNSGYPGATYSDEEDYFSGLHPYRISQYGDYIDSTINNGEYYYFPMPHTDLRGKSYDDEAYSNPILDEKSVHNSKYFYLANDLSDRGKYKVGMEAGVDGLGNENIYKRNVEYHVISYDLDSAYKITGLTDSAGNTIAYGAQPRTPDGPQSKDTVFNIYSGGSDGTCFDVNNAYNLHMTEGAASSASASIFSAFQQWDLGVKYIPSHGYSNSSNNAATYAYIGSDIESRNFYLLSANFYESGGISSSTSFTDQWKVAKKEIVGWIVDGDDLTGVAGSDGRIDYSNLTPELMANNRYIEADEGFASSREAIEWYITHCDMSSRNPLTVVAVYRTVVELNIFITGITSLNNAFNQSKIDFVNKYGKSVTDAVLKNYRVSGTNYATFVVNPGSAATVKPKTTTSGVSLDYITNNGIFSLSYADTLSTYNTNLGRAVSNNPNYKLMIGSDTNLSLHFVNGSTTSATVLDRNNKVLNSSLAMNYSLYPSGATASTGARAGFSVLAGSGSSSYPTYLGYISSNKSCTVTVSGSSYSSVNGSKTVEYDRMITLQTAGSNGSTDFKGWYSGGQLLSSSPIFRLRVTEDMTVSAVYGSAEANGSVTITDSGTENNRKYGISHWFSPEGTTFVEAGYIIKQGSAPTSSDLDNYDSATMTYTAYKVTTENKVTNGSFKLSVPSGYYALAYYFYLSSNGELVKVYSNSVIG